MAKGEPVSIPVPETIADSLQTTRPAERTLRIIRALVEEIVTVTDDELRQAMALPRLADEARRRAGRLGRLRRRPRRDGSRGVAGRRVGVVLSGGNVDPELFGRLVAGVPA